MAVKRKHSAAGRMTKAAITATANYLLQKGKRKLSDYVATRTKKRQKNGRSLTTRTKHQRRRRAPPSSGVGGQSSICKYISPVSKYTRAALAGCQVQSIQDDLATMFHSLIGSQSASIWANFGSIGTFNRIQSNYSTNFGATGSNVITQKFNIMSEVHDSSWNNPGTMPLDLTFYTLYYKKDTTYDPIAAWNDGQTQEGDGTTPVVPSNNYRALPHRSKMFMEHFKIASMKRVTLQPGEIHKRKVVWMKPRGVDSEFWANGGTINTYVAGYSMTQMVVIHGYPAPVNTGTVSAPVSSSSVATISPATVCVGVRRLVGYKFHSPLIKSFITSNSLVQTGTVTNETELVLKTESDE